MFAGPAAAPVPFRTGGLSCQQSALGDEPDLAGARHAGLNLGPAKMGWAGWWMGRGVHGGRPRRVCGRSNALMRPRGRITSGECHGRGRGRTWALRDCYRNDLRLQRCEAVRLREQTGTDRLFRPRRSAAPHGLAFSWRAERDADTVLLWALNAFSIPATAVCQRCSPKQWELTLMCQASGSCPHLQSIRWVAREEP